MKPEEAIEVLSNELIVITDMIGYCKDFEKESDLALAYRVKRQEAHNAAISAIKEIQQYREIGTVEECRTAMDYWKYLRERRCGLDAVVEKCMEYEKIGTVEECMEAVEKQKPKSPTLEGDGYDEDGEMIYDTWICPSCGKDYEVDYDDYDFCPNCGQQILH